MGHTSATSPRSPSVGGAAGLPASGELEPEIRLALNRFPTVGLAVGVVRGGGLVWFQGHGVADRVSNVPIDADTVFRIASITKTFTAIAVMQLRDRGLIDLDTPANDYLRGFALVPADDRFRPATVRHLLTHTAGVRAVRRVSDLVRPSLGWSSPGDRPPPPLDRYYHGGLRIDVEPGTRWAYSNHGYAVLGQIVADVSGVAYEHYLRDNVFDPLGMDASDAERSARVRARLATGYTVGTNGATAVTDREIVTVGASSICSSTNDMARYAAALLGGRANGGTAVLDAASLAEMFAPHHQPDPRLPGMGLGFFREDIGGHAIVGHDGIWNGFRTDLVLAPDDDLGVIVLANTGAFNPGGAPVPLARRLMRRLLGVGADSIREDVAERPATWNDLVGFYAFGPGRLVDPQPRLAFGGGLEVVVRHGHLVVRGQTPVPAIRRGLRLHPDADDADVFHLDLEPLGLGTSPIVFGRGPDGDVCALHLGLQPMSFVKRPHRRGPKPWTATGSIRPRERR